jgi:hypothetical protein
MDLANRFAASGVLLILCSPFRVVTRNASLFSWRLLKWMKEAALTAGMFGEKRIYYQCSTNATPYQ